ncbi:co-chaperone GroES [Dechloromonas sp. ZY10]|uniref:co-chaperone GroES n=1 Tax=Dechloromonas aquae TaxID=2664436 RepID=UPI0035274551
MFIRPLYDRIIVRRIEPSRTTAGGIVLPEQAGEKPEQGEVLAVGPGRRLADGQRQPLQLAIGERVLFGKYAGQAVKHGGEEYLVLREADVLGVFTS